MMSMDILLIQGLAVPCDHVFSSAKETIAMHRNHVAPTLMDALQILKFSFHSGHTLDFTDLLREDVEKRAMEAILEVQNHPSGKPLNFSAVF